MSRLLMLLTLLQNHFDAGKYISLEQLIEKTKFDYYARLQQSSENWPRNANNYEPFLDYYLSIILQAYRDLEDRVQLVAQRTPVTKLILHHLHSELRPLTKRELMALIPQYSQKSIERGLTSLQNEAKIAIVGRGRATKYRLL